MIEGSLHRALAAYVHRRLGQNAGARPVLETVRVVLMSSFGRPGHEKMSMLKDIARRAREEPLAARFML